MDEIEQLFGQSSAHPPARNNSSDSPWAWPILFTGILILLFLLVASGYIVHFSEKNVVENRLFRSFNKKSPLSSEAVDVHLNQVENSLSGGSKKSPLSFEIINFNQYDVFNFSDAKGIENNFSVVPKMSPMFSEGGDVHFSRNRDIHFPQVKIGAPSEERLRKILPGIGEKKNLFSCQQKGNLFIKHLEKNLRGIFRVGRLTLIRGL